MTDKTSQPATDPQPSTTEEPPSPPSGTAPESGRAEGPYEVTPGVYKRLTTGLGGYCMAMLACLLMVGLVVLITPRDYTETLPTADYGVHLLRLRTDAPYTPYAPEGLPVTWRATSSRLSGLEKAEDPVAWHLGMVTPSDQYAALEQSDEQPVDEYLWRMTNSREPIGVQQIAGQTWQRYYRKDKDQRSLVRTLPGLTLVVTGTASYEELAVLAASLKPQPKISATPSASAVPADRP